MKSESAETGLEIGSPSDGAPARVEAYEETDCVRSLSSPEYAASLYSYLIPPHYLPHTPHGRLLIRPLLPLFPFPAAWPG